MIRRFGVLVLLTVILAACGPLQPMIVVDFDAADRVHGGEAVLLGGQQIGRVAKRPAVENGIVQVPVLLENRHAVPRDTVFLLDSDRQGRVVLVAYPRGSALEVQRGSPPPHFRGVTSRAALAALLTGDELRVFGRWLADAFDRAVQ